MLLWSPAPFVKIQSANLYELLLSDEQPFKAVMLKSGLFRTFSVALQNKDVHECCKGDQVGQRTFEWMKKRGWKKDKRAEIERTEMENEMLENNEDWMESNSRTFLGTPSKYTITALRMTVITWVERREKRNILHMWPTHLYLGSPTVRTS